MTTQIAYAVWRNPERDNRIECIGIPVKTARTKITLAAAHPAFPGLRLDLSQVDFTPSDAFRRFVERRTILFRSAEEQGRRAQDDMLAAMEAHASNTFHVIHVEPANG